MQRPAALALTVFSIGTGIEGPYAQLGGRVLVFSFLAGFVAFLYRDAVPHDVRLFAAAVILGGALLSYRETSYLAAFPVAYATVWLGLLRLPPVPFGDLSYGVFLFHLPVIQAVRQVAGEDTAYVHDLALVVPISVGCAAISWICIERPILARKRSIVSAVESGLRAGGHALLAAGRSILWRPSSPGKRRSYGADPHRERYSGPAPVGAPGADAAVSDVSAVAHSRPGRFCRRVATERSPAASALSFRGTCPARRPRGRRRSEHEALVEIVRGDRQHEMYADAALEIPHHAAGRAADHD